MEIRAEIVIRRSREDVFAYLTDFGHLSAWASGVKQVMQTSSGARGVGTTYGIVGKAMGREMPGTYEVTIYQPPSEFGGINRGMLAFEERYHLAEVDGGTQITQMAYVKPNGIFKLLSPIMKEVLQKQLSGDFASLKRILESPSA